jgi:hypothetical protein
MRFIKLALLSFLFLFLVVTAISLLIPSHIRISRATNIAPPKETILALIKNESKWSQWHPAFMQTDSSRKIPQIKISPVSSTGSELVYQLQQENKKPVINGWKIYEHAGSDSLTLQWYMDFNLKWYPWQKFGSLLYEGTYGVMMEQGLANLKKVTNK